MSGLCSLGHSQINLVSKKRMRKRTTLMKFMKEIAYDGVEILDNDNLGKE
ncbi:hypothetical protein HanIR_Chr10g0466701 [Helianthus annuus]|nr:hypothetical protein HanIR_Chr10g0466701 [Helianthus annuus]